MYNGNVGETYLETRIHSYVEQPSESKTTRKIPPDLDSCRQQILRSHHQLFIWTRCDDYIISAIDACLNGWKTDGKTIFPVWIIDDQYPVFEKRQKKKNFEGYAGDEDEIVDNSNSKRKKRRVKSSEPGYKFRRIINQTNLVDDSFLIPEKEVDCSSGDDAEDEMEVTTDDETYIDDYDEWERLSDFAEDITSDSSDSDW